MFGAPGVGKGTYSKMIEKNFSFKSFSMGEYFRDLINDDESNDHFIQKLTKILRSG
jgi:adenylate kinase family enzyme